MSGQGEGAGSSPDGSFARPLGSREAATPVAVPFDADPRPPAVPNGDSAPVGGSGAGNGRGPVGNAGIERSRGLPASQGARVIRPDAGEVPQGPPRRRLSVFVRGQPIPQGSIVTRRGAFTDKSGRRRGAMLKASNEDELDRWRGFIFEAIRKRADCSIPIEGPVAVELTFYVMSNRRRQAAFLDAASGLYWLATTGQNDLDKLTRAVFDGITSSRYWKDDGLAVDLRARAYFASPPDTPPGVQIEIAEL